jgi:hypothetical protein
VRVSSEHYDLRGRELLVGETTLGMEGGEALKLAG